MAPIAQNKLISFVWRFALAWFFLYIATLSFDYFLLQPWFDFVSPPFRWLAEFTGMKILGVNLVGAEGFYADTLLVYVHLFNLALIAVLVSLVWTLFSKKSFRETKFQPLLFTLLRYFLALNLFIYGLAKIYKWQFMLPEPNILYTRVGDMHRDMLYWTSMGTSRGYSIFMGMIEIVPAVLLLFRRTTLIGALIAVMVMLNVVAVNFSFDITVKLHSTALLLMALLILVPGRKRIAALWNEKHSAPFSYPKLSFSESRRWISPLLKLAVIAVLLYEAHYPYTQTQNFNDDVAARPAMYGAYEIVTLDSSLTNPFTPHLPVRIFIHRRGYIIFENRVGAMSDYPVTVDSVSHTVTYNNSSFTWKALQNDTFEFVGKLDQVRARVKAVRIDLEKLPLLQEEFTIIDHD